MANTEIIVDSKAVDTLAANITEAKRAMIGRLDERGYQLLRDEVPVKFGNLKQGVTAGDVDYVNLTAKLTVSARSGRTGAGSADVMGADGKKRKTVSLRPQPAYNYAEVVARGNKDSTLSPTHAKAFLIPVSSAPSGEGYLIIGGQIYIVRRTRKGMKANPFDIRAGARLQKEAPAIGEAVLREFV